MSRKEQQEEQNTDLGKYALAFIGGAAAGVALGLYLNSDKGRETRDKLAEKVNSLEADMEQKIKQGFDDLTDKMDNIKAELKSK